jgi:glutaminase
MTAAALWSALTEAGIDTSRPEVVSEVEAITGGADRFDVAEVLAHPDSLCFKAITGQLAVPDWKAFTAQVRTIFEGIKRDVHDGSPADYIPILAEANPDWFSVSICTVDGQQFDYGDTDVGFSIQSCTKPLMYAVAVEDRGLSYVHRHVGFEPSGLRFNEVRACASQRACVRA